MQLHNVSTQSTPFFAHIYNIMD